MHTVLDRQIKKFFANSDSISEELKAFFEIIGKTYEHFDENRSLMERALGLSSQELTAINNKLRSEIEKVNIQTLKLEESRIKDEAILSSIGDGMVVTDKEGKIVIMNNQAELMLGWKFSDIKNQVMSDLISIEDKNWVRIQKNDHPIQLAITSGKRISNNSYYYVRKDNAKFPVAITASPVILENEISGAILVFRDITKEVDIDRVKTEFVSLASHQIRTPLSTIRWYIEMLLSGDAGTLGDKQKEYLETIYTSTKRMIDLVNSLLSVSRLELGTFAVEPEPTNLVNISNSALKDLEPQIKNNRLGVITNYDPNLPTINVDPKLMQIIFQNLVSNSIKYTPTGGEIKVEIKKRENDILIKISDNGYGIPQYQQNQIFTKLFRADNIKEKDSEGTGLGLYIVKSIIDHSGGEIWFESAENEGTAFYATIPLTGMTKKEENRELQ